jgi:hypothetical protein
VTRATNQQAADCIKIDSLILKLFKDAVSTTEAMKCRMKWEDYHNWWVGKNIGGSCGLFEGIILEFAWRDWGKPQETLVTIASHLVEIHTGNLNAQTLKWMSSSQARQVIAFKYVSHCVKLWVALVLVSVLGSYFNGASIKNRSAN